MDCDKNEQEDDDLSKEELVSDDQPVVDTDIDEMVEYNDGISMSDDPEWNEIYNIQED